MRPSTWSHARWRSRTFPDLLAALESFARVLRPEGLAVISEIHPIAVMTGAHAFFRSEDGSRAVTPNVQHWVGDYVVAAIRAGFSIEACTEAFIDDALLTEFGVPEDPMHPEYAVSGLPFAIIWSLRRSLAR